MDGMMHDRKAVDSPVGRARHVFEFERLAVAADAERRVLNLVTVQATLNPNLPRREELPVVVVHLRDDPTLRHISF
jgi:hypothetical protein